MHKSQWRKMNKMNRYSSHQFGGWEMGRSGVNRIDGIDFWRGFALLTIFIDHAPENIFQRLTHGNFGFSDAADLFVFLSGASVALAYGSPFFPGETTAAIRAVFRRALTLYCGQLLLSLLTIGIFVARRR